jgi:hypothetical protein
MATARLLTSRLSDSLVLSSALWRAEVVRRCLLLLVRVCEKILRVIALRRVELNHFWADRSEPQQLSAPAGGA